MTTKETKTLFELAHILTKTHVHQLSSWGCYWY